HRRRRPLPRPLASPGMWRKNGATKGPFSETDLAALAASGGLTRASHVWTAGQDGWKLAADTDLARLFDAVPPPPPGV
ncbi:DUF4339 domain-containing protein, partial [Rhodobacter ferrooxidans]